MCSCDVGTGVVCAGACAFRLTESLRKTDIHRHSEGSGRGEKKWRDTLPLASGSLQRLIQTFAVCWWSGTSDSVRVFRKCPVHASAWPIMHRKYAGREDGDAARLLPSDCWVMIEDRGLGGHWGLRQNNRCKFTGVSLVNRLHSSVSAMFGRLHTWFPCNVMSDTW